MANKYIIHGATYNGDGTTSSEAASNGAAGAWNTIDYMTGTTPVYGAINNGDTINIRSKSSAGADITVTLAANITLGKAGATVGSQITWRLDGGTIWPGINGVLTFSSSGAYYPTFEDFNVFECEVQDAMAVVNTASNVSVVVATWKQSTLRNLLIDWSGQTGTATGRFTCGITASRKMIGESLHVKAGALYGGVFYVGTNSSGVSLRTPDIELTKSDTDPVFFCSALQNYISVFGGRLYGLGAISGAPLCSNPGGARASFIGFDFPIQMPVCSGPGSQYGGTIEVFSPDGGSGAVYADAWGRADSRDDGYYPTCNAQYPNSTASGWSWRVYPNGVTSRVPMEFAFAAKLFTDSAAQKTLTLAFLVSDTYAGLSKAAVWMDGYYIDDTTGLSTYFTTQSTGALDSSSATWSANTYGAINLLPRQISITTPTAVRQDTTIVTRFCCTSPTVSSDDIFFVDPDVLIS